LRSITPRKATLPAGSYHYIDSNYRDSVAKYLQACMLSMKR
jgi:hypothetical protein